MQLNNVLNRMANLLILDNSNGNWVNSLLGFVHDLDSIDEDDIKREISMCFGGSGSLNDTWLTDPVLNKEFRSLLAKLYSMSHDRKNYISK